MTVAIIGLGLIGGSIGLDLVAAGRRVLAVDPDGPTRAQAIDQGIEPVEFDEAVGSADLVVVATPPGVVGESVARAASLTDAPVTDVASVCDPAALGMHDGLPATWVGGHPMGGTERSTFRAARRGLLVGAPWLLTPHDAVDRRALATVVELALQLQARPIVVTADAHDQFVATVSHVPHLLAYAVQQAGRDVGGDVVEAVAGPSFRDATRVAASDPAFWADLLTRNHKAVRAATVRVQAWLDAATDPATDREALQDMLGAARRRPGPRTADGAHEQVDLHAGDALKQLRAAGAQGRAVASLATVAGAPIAHLAPATHR